MVKRTAVVLGITSLLLVGFTSAALAQWGGCGDWETRPLYIGVKCPPVTSWTTIIKTWEGKVEAPYMPIAGGWGPGNCGTPQKENPLGLLGALAAGIATPLDWLFGGTDGVYGCGLGAFAGGVGAGACDANYGPLPGFLAFAPQQIAGFTTLWPWPGQLW